MPHALFLGSSLASVDRLDMVPRPPKTPSASRRMARRALPSFLRRRKDKDSHQEESYEMESSEPQTGHTLTGLNEEGVRPPVTRVASIGGREMGGVGLSANIESEEQVKDLQVLREGSADGDDDEEDGRRDEFMVAMKKYEAKLGAFNRIRWVDLHLKHATVNSCHPAFRLPVQFQFWTLADNDRPTRSCHSWDSL